MSKVAFRWSMTAAGEPMVKSEFDLLPPGAGLKWWSRLPAVESVTPTSAIITMACASTTSSADAGA